LNTTLDHRNRVLEHQQLAQLFSCSLEELFEIYQKTEPDPTGDTSWMRLIYSIGGWRFGAAAWSNRHTEYFKQRARDNAELGIPTPGRVTKREQGQKLSLADLGL
jgi:hypothetical protein